MADSFAAQIAQFALKTGRTMDRVVVDSRISVGSAIIDDTPVGDPSLWQRPAPPDYRAGTLVNSWFSTINAPWGGDVRKQNKGGRASFNDLIVVAELSPRANFHFVNPAPYARRIEFGHSTQAPTGMVRNAVQEFPDMVKRAVGANK